MLVKKGDLVRVISSMSNTRLGKNKNTGLVLETGLPLNAKVAFGDSVVWVHMDHIEIVDYTEDKK